LDFPDTDEPDVETKGGFMKATRFAGALTAGLMLITAGVASAQSYPTKPIRFITAGAGGGNDFVARLVADGIQGPLGQAVVVENRPGVATIPGQVVSQSAPDGYTVLVYGPGTWLSQFLRSDVPYDVERDFAPVSILDRQPLLVVVQPSLNIKSVKELIAHAKAKPGELNFSTGGDGSTSHLAPELFKHMTGVNMVRIPYKSGSQEITDLLGGRVHLTFSTGAAAPLASSGKLRAIAHTGDRASILYPDLPTVASTVPGYRAVSFTAMFVPAKAPEIAVKRLNEETVRFLNTTYAKAKLYSVGSEAVGSTPEELRAAVRAETTRWGKVIKDAGIKVQ
jgi:tripartite-type tricarboxylate transporter receptor subunit TctC